jgi:MoaA/NifB/PqqE/SkfB family radical SAM enzyme
MRSGDLELWGKAAAIKDKDQEIRKTLEKIVRMTESNPRILFSKTTYRYAAEWKDYSKDRYEADELSSDDRFLREGPRCQAGRYYMTVLPDGTVCPCVATIGKIRCGNVISDGVAESWQNLQKHECLACYAPCLVEQNYLFSLKPQVVLNFLSKHLARFN